MLILGEGSEATEPYNKYATVSIVGFYIGTQLSAFGKFIKVLYLGLNCRGTQLTLFAFGHNLYRDSICIGTQFVLGLNLFWDSIVASPFSSEHDCLDKILP